MVKVTFDKKEFLHELKVDKPQILWNGETVIAYVPTSDIKDDSIYSQHIFYLNMYTNLSKTKGVIPDLRKEASKLKRFLTEMLESTYNTIDELKAKIEAEKG